MADFDYKPEEDEASNPKTITWTASEYIDHQQGASWYLGLIILTLLIAAVIYLLTKEVFGTGVVLALGIIIGLAARRKPEIASYELSNRGLKVNQKFYPYSQFRAFSVIHESQIDSLVFDPLKRFTPPVSAYFDAGDEQRIVGLVGEHLPLQPKAPDPIDVLSRRLRF